MKILFSRPDRIGDVILSLPTLQAWKMASPKDQIGLCVQHHLKNLLANEPGIDFLVSVNRADGSMKTVVELTDEIRALGVDMSVSLIPNFVVDRALKRAGVPKRVGLRNKWFTYFFYTLGMRQRRSQVKKHEAEYNLDLARLAGLTFDDVAPRPRLNVSGELSPQLIQKLSQQGWTAQKNKPRVLIHPGMGGSALNWDARRYVDLGVSLWRGGADVLFSFGPQEKALQKTIAAIWNEQTSGLGWKSFEGDQNDLASFTQVLKMCDLVIAPSTGPLHLANASHVPTVGIFPPILVQHPKRWGPWGQDKGRVFLPEVECPARYDCIGSNCKHFPCMNRIEVSNVIAEAKSLLGPK